MTHKEVEKYLLGLPNARLDYPFGENTAVYKFIPIETSGGKKTNPDVPTESVGSRKVNPDVSKDSRGKMFALVAERSDPVRISLKCDPILAETLRQKYESVMPGYHLNKKHWNTILLTGQLSWDEVKDLIKLSYDLVSGAV